MPAPNLTFTVTDVAISDEVGFNKIEVSFSADMEYQAFECRAPKNGAEYGVGKGALISSFSATPANVQRTFEIYDTYLTAGDGQYRISLFAQAGGAWNDNHYFVPSGAAKMLTADGLVFLCAR